jgi:segregation and condensation protein A
MDDVVEPADTGGPAVELEVFSGPLDLLLHLIKKNEVSVYDIPIVTICDQYHEYLDAMSEIDLEVAGEFLWMASWLLQLKSKMLLPRHDDEAEDPREELVERLLEYRRVKELAALLYEKDVVRRCLWAPGLDTDLTPEEVEIEWAELDLRRLASAYLDAMERFAADHPAPLQVLPLRYRVRDTMREIYQKIMADDLIPLLRDLNQRSDPEEVVVVFVSALELVRLGAVCAEQTSPFAEIYLRKGPNDIDLDSIEAVESGDSGELTDGA